MGYEERWQRRIEMEKVKESDKDMVRCLIKGNEKKIKTVGRVHPREGKLWWRLGRQKAR